jgi:hypothetical protein
MSFMSFCWQVAMAVFDLPEAVAVTRITVCNAGGTLDVISRLQVRASLNK